jgi:hypothetical protein
MDSRGWVVKNLNFDPSSQSIGFGSITPTSDRLFDVTSVAQVPDLDIKADEDILDPVSNMVAQRFDKAIKEQHADKISKLKDIASGKTPPPAETVDYSFITSPTVDPGYTSFGEQVVAPVGKSQPSDSFLQQPSTQTAEETNFLSQIHTSKEIDRELARNGHGNLVTPINLPRANQPEQITNINTSTGRAPDDILEKLGQSGSELNVSSLESLARHAEGESAMKQDDVISLH